MSIKRFIIMVECADGNESIGTEWISTFSVTPETTVADIFLSAMKIPSSGGRIMIARDRNENSE